MNKFILSRLAAVLFSIHYALRTPDPDPTAMMALVLAEHALRQCG